MSTLNRDAVPPADATSCTADGSRHRGEHGSSPSPHVGWAFGPELFDALPSPMALIAPSGIVAEVNAAWSCLTGDDPDVDVGRPLWQRFSPAERAHLAALVERFAHADEQQRRPTVTGTQLRRRDGKRVDVALRLGVTADGRGPRILLAQLEPLADDRDRTVRRAGTGDRHLALRTIARAVATGGGLQRVGQQVIEAIARATGCPLVGVWRRASARESLVLVNGLGFPPSAYGRLVLDTDPDGLAGHTLRARDVMVIGGPSGTVARLPTVLDERGVTSGAAVGVYGTAGADGLLTVCAAHNQPLPPDAVRFLAIVGDLLSMALQREGVDDLIAAERRRTTDAARELEVLRRRHALAHDAAGLAEWRWAAPHPVDVDRRMSPPPELSLAACLDGGPQAVVDAAVADDAPAIAETLNTCMRLSGELDCTVRLHTVDGVAPVRLRGVVERDGDGLVREMSGFAAVSSVRIRALTAPAGADSQRTSDPLASTAHDLNNLLAAILGTAEHLVDGAPDRRRLAAIVRAGRRARELVAGLRSGHADTHPLAGAYELADVVEQIRPLLPGLVGAQIELVYDLRRGARISRLARDEVERILLNLIINSRDAMDAGGTIRIAVDACTQLDDRRGAQSAPPVGSWARLAVTDDGAGMASGDRARAFEPGFTTKRATQHAGLGLASVRDAVAAAGGVIGVTSALGRGTTVEIYVPLATRAAVKLQPLRPRALPASAVGPAETGRRTALLVDDEPAVRDLLTTLLERLDFTVVVAPDGEHALALADGIDDVTLVVSDLRMPGIDGLTLGRRVRQIHPGAALVLLTGAPPDAPIADRSLRVVRKPFDWETLRDAVVSLSPPPTQTPAALDAVYPAASG